jgi:wyosine [tRNA(Phe)-imidazoG37] synthetase (radical SAM superfamily)
VLEELRRRLGEVEVDCVTLAGSGEPTLHQDLGRIIQAVKGMTAAPVVVITNGSLLWDPQVRRELLGADIVMPDLDAGDEETFGRINQPCAGLDFAKVIEGLRAFRREYSGKIHLEVFLVSGINDSQEQVAKIAELARQLEPDSIDVNTVTRPPADAAAQAVPPERLEELARLLGPHARVIASRSAAAGKAEITQQDILAMVGRHPCTLEDLSAGLQADPQQVLRLVTQMVEQGQLSEKRQNGGSFFVVGGRQDG